MPDKGTFVDFVPEGQTPPWEEQPAKPVEVEVVVEKPKKKRKKVKK